MQNQRLPKVDMAKSGYPRSRFNFSHDVNTTADFGLVQPAMCKHLIPGSKTTLSTESLTRLAPMLVPTFGRLKYKIWHQFVEMADICETYNALMAQQPQYSAKTQSTFVPYNVPSMALSCLGSLVLIGARATIYLRTAGSNGYDYRYESFRSNVSGDVQSLGYLLTTAKDPLDTSFFACPLHNATSDNFTSLSTQHLMLNLCDRPNGAKRRGVCAEWNTEGSADMPFRCPVGNIFNASSQGADRFIDFGFIYDSNGKLINVPVTIDGADFLWDFDFLDASNATQHATIAFRFSDFGKQLRKILIGLGYQINMAVPTQVNVLPLFAYYKAYWNLFGLTQWKDWQQTSCYKLIKFLNQATPYLDYCTSTDAVKNPDGIVFLNLFIEFVKDLADSYVTDSTDFVSAHTPTPAISPASGQEFISYNYATGNPVLAVDSAGSVDGTPQTAIGHSFINQVNHGQVDSEYMKRLYKWTNRNTIVGRRIAEILKSQGLGRFVDECKSDFIGYTEDVVQISDVVSTADTLVNGSGASLGEFGGKGVQYTKGKSFTYENDVAGYWITLCAIVPETGYSQQMDPTLFAHTKFQFYNPEFDSLGMNTSRKVAVQGASDWKSAGYHPDMAGSFGFKPVYFEYKFAQNVTNGDMSRRGSRSNYLPYFLDRFIALDDKLIKPVSGDETAFLAKDSMKSTQFPTAGNLWRYPTKYRWLGNLNRMFARTSEFDDNDLWIIDSSEWQQFVICTFDNFLIHNIFDMQCYAPMLAVEDSFETTDDNERPNMSVGKA